MKNTMIKVEASTDFEKRYGTEKTFGIAMEREQRLREKHQIKELLKARYKRRKGETP